MLSSLLKKKFCSLRVWSIQVCAHTMPRRKDISNDIKEATVAALQYGNGNKAMSKQFGTIILQWENIQDSCQYSQEWTSQQVYLKVRGSNINMAAQRSAKVTRSVKLHHYLIATVKHGGEGLFWACFVAIWPGHLSTTDYAHKSILESTVKPSLQSLIPGQSCQTVWLSFEHWSQAQRMNYWKDKVLTSAQLKCCGSES